MVSPIDITASIGFVALAGAGVRIVRSLVHTINSVNKSVSDLVKLYENAAAEHVSIFSQHENALKQAVKSAIHESILVTRPATAIEQKHGR